jgi:hypothetical protein
VRAFGSNVTLRPDQPISASEGSPDARLIAARNEFESFQVAVQAGDSPLRRLQLDVSEVTGPGGSVIPDDHATIYREAAYDASQSSDGEGGTGPWFDPLIPETDYFFGENRNAFPVDLAPRDRVVALVDMLVPAASPPGEYTGTVSVREGSNVLATVPLLITVLDLELPSTTTLRSAFPIHSYQVCIAHTGETRCDAEDPEEEWRLAQLYARAGLENRISVATPLPGVFGDSGAQQAPVAPKDRSRFEEFILPLIAGDDSNVRLSGAALTSLIAYASCTETADPNHGNVCLADWMQLSEELGFSKLMLLYVCDEPFVDSAVWSDCDSTAADAREIWPGVARLITTSIDDAAVNDGLADVDVLAPVINFLSDKPDSDYEGNQRKAYDAFLASTDDPSGGFRNELWTYTSCLSYSCDSDEDDYWDGWPGYAIDAPGAQARALGALAWLYDVEGELYYNVGTSLEDAWTDSYEFGGNGDGNLFYPGLPAGGEGIPAIGGESDIPIESLRLKRIRDGREDYEYLRALESEGRGELATEIVESLYGDPDTAAFGATVNQRDLDAARCRLAAAMGARKAPLCKR